MLLDVMIATEADGPAIGRLEPRASVGIAPNMRALDGSTETIGDATMVLVHPGTMRRALTVVGLARPLAFKPVR
jgi:hypothetical protein